MLIAPLSVAVRVPVYLDPDSTLAPPDSIEAAFDTMSVTAPLDSASAAATPTASLVLDQPSHERVTKFTLAGGGGRYYREVLVPLGAECSEPVPIHDEYVDIGAEIDHQVSKKGHIGLRGGFIRDTAQLAAEVDTMIAGLEGERETDTYYANPYFSIEWDRFGIGAGVLLSDNELEVGEEDEFSQEDDGGVYPTAHLRVGHLSKFYVSAHLFEGVPVYSGAGLFVAGVGGRPVPSLELYGAYCAEGTYREDSFLARATLDVTRSWTHMTTVRFPTTYSSSFGEHEDSEYGVSLGLSYRIYRTQ